MKNTIIAIFSILVLGSCNKTNTGSCCVGGKVTGMDSSFVAVPDIFTPNGDGVNDILYPRSKYVTNYKFTVERGNKLVFETTNPASGWDGTYKGKTSKERDYSYTVEATTLGGTALSLSGNICLIRDNCSKTPIVDCCFDSQFNGTGFDKTIPSGESIKVCN